MFVRNPLFIATMLGIMFSVFQIPIHRSASNLMDMLSATAGPAALFALGLSLIGHSILGNIYETIWASVLKLIAQPLFTFILATEVFYLSPFWSASVVILSAMPVGSTAYLIGQQYGVAERVSSATVAVSTAGSVVTLTALMIYYGVS